MLEKIERVRSRDHSTQIISSAYLMVEAQKTTYPSSHLHPRLVEDHTN